MKKSIASLGAIFIFMSCVTQPQPIVYDKTIDLVEKKSQIIYRLIRDDKFEEAHTQLESSLKLYPGNPDLMLYQGWLLLKEKRYQESEKIFLQIKEKNKKNPLAFAGLARLYRLTGQSDKAMQQVEIGLSLQTGYSILWFEKALLEYENNDYQQALIHFTRSYQIDRQNNDAYFFKYLLMLKSGYEIDEIKHYWEKIVKLEQQKSWYYLYHAHAHQLLGDQSSALLVARQGLAQFPDDIYLNNFCAYLLLLDYQQDEKSEVLAEAEKYILKLSDQSLPPSILDTYFLYLEIKQEYEKLNTEVKKSALLFPESKVLINWLKKINSF